MKSRIKTLAVFAVIASSVIVAGAQDQPRQDRPLRKAKEFKCPVCGSPCVSKAEMAKLHRMRQARINQAQAMRANRPGQARHLNARQGPDGRQAFRERANLKPRAMRFDIDGDGQLSRAERAARRAYVQAMRTNQGNQPAPRRPVRRAPVDE